MKSWAVSLLAMLAITSCGAPGRQAAETRVVPPGEIRDFRVLYSQNCSGCHGADGQGGLSLGLGNPVYLAIAGDATIRRITAQGVPGTAMPAFAQEAGGLLTDAQIDALVGGIRGRWAKPGAFDNQQPPPYTASQPGDPARGQSLFNTICSSCHGRDGRGTEVTDEDVSLVPRTDAGFGRCLQRRRRDAGRSSGRQISADAGLPAGAGGKPAQCLVPQGHRQRRGAAAS